MYTFNWDAGYSTDGGQTFKELDPHTVFPSDIGSFPVHFGTDQVVVFDPTTQTFIWVLQEFGSGVEDAIRIAWTTATKLEQFGKFAWRWIDLRSDGCCGFGAGHWLDQPKIGFTPKYFYMNLNEGTGNTIQHTVIIRIPRDQFRTAPQGYGFWSLFRPRSGLRRTSSDRRHSSSATRTPARSPSRRSETIPTSPISRTSRSQRSPTATGGSLRPAARTCSDGKRSRRTRPSPA